MATDSLTSNEKSRLLDLLFDSNVTFDAVEKKFKELFPVARFPVAAKELKPISRDLIAACDGQALVTALYIVDVMRRAECMPAKALLFDILVELEKAIRKDMFLQEQIKYASKETKEARKSIDAVHADELRVHCAAKVFVFVLLGGKAEGDTKPSTIMSTKQDAIDSALDAWEKTSMKIKEPLSDISHCWSSEKEKQRCGAPLENGAIFDNSHPQKRSAVLMRGASAKTPSMPVSAGEMQFLLPGEKSFLLFDSEVPSAEWDTAKRLLTSAGAGPLSPGDRETLLTSLSEAVMKHMDVSDKVVADIAQHNPEVCAAVLAKLPAPARSLRLQHLITGTVDKANVGTVLVNAPKAMEQLNLRTFVTESLKCLQEKSGSSDAAVNFIDRLYQLTTKGSKENKELYIADALKADLEKLVKSVNNSDVTAKWEEMKS